jgi:hypothetical protein
LHDFGFVPATDVVGDFEAWAAAGLPVEAARLNCSGDFIAADPHGDDASRRSTERGTFGNLVFSRMNGGARPRSDVTIGWLKAEEHRRTLRLDMSQPAASVTIRYHAPTSIEAEHLYHEDAIVRAQIGWVPTSEQRRLVNDEPGVVVEYRREASTVAEVVEVLQAILGSSAQKPSSGSPRSLASRRNSARQRCARKNR